MKAVGAVVGSILFRLVYTLALSLNMPAYMLKAVSSVIVILAISGPYFSKNFPELKRRLAHRRNKAAVSGHDGEGGGDA